MLDRHILGYAMQFQRADMYYGEILLYTSYVSHLCVLRVLEYRER